jgi:hypothetical protein
MATLRDLATDALLDLGVLSAGEVGDAGDYASALRAINRLLDQWAGERLQIYTITATTWSIVGSTQSYDIGAGQAINRARPMFVDHVSYRDSSGNEFPLSRFTEDGWAAVTAKTTTSTVPDSYYYNPTYPYSRVTLYPVPTTSVTGVLYAPTAVAEFSSINDAILLPPGYRRMLVKNLAVELAPSYQRQIHPEISAAASQSKTIVKRNNWRPSEMSFDALALVGGGGGYDIETDC